MSKNNTGKQAHITQLIVAASCTLLASASSNEASSAEKQENSWNVDIAVLSYSESGRVHVNQSLLDISSTSDQRIIDIKLDADSVSGPSENGAVSSRTPQTITNPSGKSSLNYKANQSPFWEVENHNRYSASYSSDEIFSPKYTLSYGGRYSYEHSYISKSVHLGVIRNANKKNTQFSLNGSYEDATVAPLGGIVIPGERTILRDDYQNDMEFQQDWERLHDGSEKKKRVTDIKFGLTQVINKNTLVQLGYLYGNVSGYQNDALKLVSVIDLQGEPIAHIFERRPDKRKKQVVNLNAKFNLADNTVLGVKYRYYADSWGIQSSTIQTGLQYRLSDGWKIEPTLRVYSQNKADFYQHSVFSENESEHSNEYMSADYRLASSINYTVGFNIKYQFKNKNSIALRLAKYKINTKDENTSKRGYLNQIDVSPDIDATIIMLSYGF